MKVLKIIGLAIISLIALFFIIPLFMETEYKVERSIAINANQETVHDFMKHFSNFDRWSPWTELDPKMSTEISGVDGELGAKYYWKGNSDVGEGLMEITSLSNDEINIHLKFIEPFAAESPTTYRFSEKDNQTTVTWYMEGEMSYPWNIFGLFMSMEDEIGNDFEKGLSKLKREIEKLEIEIQSNLR